MPLVTLNKSASQSSVQTASGSISAIAYDGLLDGVFTQLQTCSYVHFRSDGQLSMHDFLITGIEYLKTIVDPSFHSSCVVHLTTFSMTEFSARILAQLKDSGDISELHILIDKEAQIRYPNVNQLITNVCDTIGHVSIHAKVLLIKMGSASLTMLSSANWTKNPRIEVGVIDSDLNIYQYHRSWIDAKIKTASND